MRFVFPKLSLYAAAFSPFGSIWGYGTNPQTRLMISAWVISALPGRRHPNGWCILHKAIVSWEQTSTSHQQPKRLFSWGWNCPYKSVCQVHICSSSNTSFGIEVSQHSLQMRPNSHQVFLRKNKAFGPFWHCTIWHHLFNSGSDPLGPRWAIFWSPQRLAIWPDWLSCSLKKTQSSQTCEIANQVLFPHHTKASYKYVSIWKVTVSSFLQRLHTVPVFMGRWGLLPVFRVVIIWGMLQLQSLRSPGTHQTGG